MQYRIAMLGLILSVPSACSHTPRSRPVVGFLGRQCAAEPRDVFCAANLTDRDCEYLEESVDYLNHVSARTYFNFVGRASSDLSPSPTNLIVTYSPKIHHLAPWQADRAAETGVRVNSLGCTVYVTMEIFLYDRDMSTGARLNMFRHELLHALGLPHELFNHDALMAPSGDVAMPEPLAIDAAELNALDALYGSR